MNSKKYLNISEVSKLLGIQEHKIRYWDSVDKKTNKVRVEGICTKSKGGTRYFNRENIQKLTQLKTILYDNTSNYKPLDLANKIISNKKINMIKKEAGAIHSNSENEEKRKKMKLILQNMRNSVKI